MLVEKILQNVPFLLEFPFNNGEKCVRDLGNNQY